MGQRVFGIAKVRLNGVDHRTKPGSEIALGGYNKTSSFASGKRTGAVWEAVAARVTCIFEMMADSDIASIRDFDGTCEVETDTGAVFAVANGDMTEPPTVQDGGRGINCTIEGDASEAV